MKTLLMFRHSVKDGRIKDTIGTKGFALAIEQGDQLVITNRNINLVAYGPLLRTRQTLLAMLAPLGLIPAPEDQLEVREFGSDEFFAEFNTKPGFKEIAAERVFKRHSRLEQRRRAHSFSEHRNRRHS